MRVSRKRPLVIAAKTSSFQVLGHVEISFVQAHCRIVWIIFSKHSSNSLTHRSIFVKIRWKNDQLRTEFLANETRHCCSNTVATCDIIRRRLHTTVRVWSSTLQCAFEYHQYSHNQQYTMSNDHCIISDCCNRTSICLLPTAIGSSRSSGRSSISTAA